MSIAAFQVSQKNASGPESADRIDEAFLLKHSGTFARECRRRTHAENPVLKTYIREFEQFVLQREPKLLAVVRAIQRTATLYDAEKSIGMANRDFRRCRRDLSLLKNRFLEQRKSWPQTRELSSSWETPMEKKIKVFLREELYDRVWTSADAPAGEGVRLFGRGPCETMREAQYSETRRVLAAIRVGPQTQPAAAAGC